MVSLLLSIVFSTGLFVVFGYLKKYKLQPLPTIVCNYFTAATLGFCLHKEPWQFTDVISSSWSLVAMLLAGLFISTFNLMGKVAQSQGVTLTTIASKMSMVVPIAFSVFFIKEGTDLQKLAGIVLAMAAVFFAAQKGSGNTSTQSGLGQAILIFTGCGLVDLGLKYLENTYYHDSNFALLNPSLFFFAGVYGVSYFVIFDREAIRAIQMKNILFGILLGTINYFSLVFMFDAMADHSITSSMLFPLNNLGIVLLSAALSVVLFKEKLNKQNKIGLALALAAVITILW